MYKTKDLLLLSSSFGRSIIMRAILYQKKKMCRRRKGKKLLPFVFLLSFRKTIISSPIRLCAVNAVVEYLLLLLQSSTGDRAPIKKKGLHSIEEENGVGKERRLAAAPVRWLFSEIFCGPLLACFPTRFLQSVSLSPRLAYREKIEKTLRKKRRKLRQSTTAQHI